MKTQLSTRPVEDFPSLWAAIEMTSLLLQQNLQWSILHPSPSAVKEPLTKLNPVTLEPDWPKLMALVWLIKLISVNPMPAPCKVIFLELGMVITDSQLLAGLDQVHLPTGTMTASPVCAELIAACTSV
jgi:hypothetical protein